MSNDQVNMIGNKCDNDGETGKKDADANADADNSVRAIDGDDEVNDNLVDNNNNAHRSHDKIRNNGVENDNIGINNVVSIIDKGNDIDVGTNAKGNNIDVGINDKGNNIDVGNNTDHETSQPGAVGIDDNPGLKLTFLLGFQVCF